MSDTDDQQQPARAGTYADLARRMDRMEARHEDLAKEVTALTAAVGQIASNQDHATELNKLRFDALDSRTMVIATDLKGFMSRMEGIMTGDIQTAAARDLKDAKEQAEREGAKVMAEWTAWRNEVEAKVEAMEDRELKRSGMMQAFTGTKAVVLMIAAIASPIVAAIGIIVTRPGAFTP